MHVQLCLDQIQWKTEKQCLWLANLVYVPINERPKVQEKLLLKGRNLVTNARSCNEISTLKKESITQFQNAKRQLERDYKGVIVR